LESREIKKNSPGLKILKGRKIKTLSIATMLPFEKQEGGR